MRLSEEIPGFAYADVGATVSDVYGSLRFADDSGTSLDYEVECWDTSGESVVWVSLPRLDGRNVKFTAYWSVRSNSALPEVFPTNVWISAGYVGVFYRPSKDVVTRLLARNWNGSTNYSNYVDLYIAENGTATVSMSHPAAWLSALGLSLPIAVGKGGTGAVGVSLDNTISNIVTAASGFTFTSAEYAQWGKDWDGKEITGLNGKTYALMPNGNIQVTGAMSVGSVCEITFTYLLPDL